MLNLLITSILCLFSLSSGHISYDHQEKETKPIQNALEFQNARWITPNEMLSPLFLNSLLSYYNANFDNFFTQDRTTDGELNRFILPTGYLISGSYYDSTALTIYNMDNVHFDVSQDVNGGGSVSVYKYARYCGFRQFANVIVGNTSWRHYRFYLWETSNTSGSAYLRFTYYTAPSNNVVTDSYGNVDYSNGLLYRSQCEYLNNNNNYVVSGVNSNLGLKFVNLDAGNFYQMTSLYFDTMNNNVDYANAYYNGVVYGERIGYNRGESDGLHRGLQVGYQRGLDHAAQENQTALTIFTGIIDVGLLPVNVFLQMFNYEIFGVNIAGFISSILTIAIVIIVVRIITGNKNDD